MVDAAGLRCWRRRHSVCNIRAHPGRRLGTGSLGLLRAGMGPIRLWGCAGRPVRPGRGPVCRNGFRLGPLVHLAGWCLPAGLPARLLVPRGQRIPGHTRAVGGGQRPGAPPATDRQARSWRWMFLMGAANITPAPRASAWAADSGVSSPWLTIRPLPLLPWSSGLPGSTGSTWLSLACTTAQLPRERDRRRMEDPGRAARQG